MTLEATKYTVAIATDGELIPGEYGEYKLWQGWSLYDNAPMIPLVGTETKKEKDDPKKPGEKIILRSIRFKSADGSEDYGYLNINEVSFDKKDRATGEILTDENGNPIKSSFVSVKSQGISFMGLYLPMSGFLNEHNGGASCKLKLDTKTISYYEDPATIEKNAIAGKQVPTFALTDYSCEIGIDLLMAFRENYSEFGEWHSKWFPGSKSMAIDTDKLARSKALLELIKKGSKTTTEKLDKVPWD